MHEANAATNKNRYRRAKPSENRLLVPQGQTGHHAMS